MRSITCPELGPVCGELAIPDHVRRQSLTSVRLQLGATIGLGKGFTLGVSLPLELKGFGLRHELPDGSPYSVPYALPIAEDVLVGPGDLRFLGGLAGGPPGTPLLLSAGIGVMIPTGRTSSNPFTEAVATQRQFRQFGNGTFDPVAEVSLVVGTKPVGFLTSGSTRVPLYTNRKGYRGQFLLSGSAGIVVFTPKPLDTVRLLLLAEASHAGAARWDGAVAENSGRDSLGVRTGFEWSVLPKLVVRGSLLVQPVQTWRGEQFSMPWTVGLGLSGIIHLRKKEP